VSDSVAGVTVTVATGLGWTFTVAEPVFPSLVAVMVTEPTATPLTRPLDVTVATLVLLDDHDIARLVAGAPLTSVSVAESWTLDP
jgi:hypothetical protein